MRLVNSDWPNSLPANYISNIKRLLPLTEDEFETILSNDTVTRLFGSTEARHSNLEDLQKTLKEGVD
ncbi:MAG: hypothetical protein GX228_10370 [Firmicutes bacterium]|nr:hypothetical protein [Bacillota bacterium]HKM17364.1 hypothetical protein [Limnochordia bacterium]